MHALVRSRWPALLAVSALASMLALLPGTARASQPRLDELGARAGIDAGELKIGVRTQVPAPGRSVRVGVGAERRSLSLHGLPLRGAFETVWISSAGSERVVASAYPSRDARLRPEQLEVGRVQARQALAPHLRADQLERLEGTELPAGLEGELVYLMLAETPLLAWQFTAPLSLSPVPSRQQLWVSARTGKVIDAVELVDSEHEAEVFEENPKSTPDPVLVTLPNIVDDQLSYLDDETPLSETYLTGSRVRVFNCLDEEPELYGPWRRPDEEVDRPECYPSQTVVADAEQDFFVPLPQVGEDAANIDPTDAYAELSMYFHAEKFFDYMVGDLGIEGFPCETANMVANFHWLEPAPLYPERSYGPLNNAYYTNDCSVDEGPTMVFGQGSSIDFGFDGDVVYHELGHGIVAGLTPEGLRSRHLRGEAVLMDARAVNESLADYQTIMLTDKPELADYAGFYWPDLDRAWIRSALNEKACPSTMAGQQHNDGEPFTAALWATRTRIGGDKLDPVVLASLPLLARDTSIEQASAALLQVAEAEREAGVWTAEEVEILERAFAARNLYDCPRIIDDPISLEDSRYMYLQPKTNFVAPFFPGPVQFRQVIPADSDNLILSFDAQGPGNSAGLPVDYDVTPLLLVKRSSLSEDAPMAYEYELAGLGFEDEEDADTDVTWQVFGDWDEIYTPTRLGEKRRQIILRGLEPGEVLHLTFAASDRKTTIVRELYFDSLPTDTLDEGSPEQEGEEDPGADEDGDGSGCACATEGPGGSGGTGLGGLALLALWRRRSRER